MRCLIALLLSVSVAWSATMFVATTGNDSTGDGSIGNPYLTITNGLTKLSAGDTLFIRGGNYHEKLDLATDGASNSVITVSGYSNETVRLDGEYVLPTCAGCSLFYVSGDWITVTNLTITRSAHVGLRLLGTFDTATYVTSCSNKEQAILVGGGDSSPSVRGSYCTVEYCSAWWNAADNEWGALGANWPSTISAARHPNNTTLRHNRSWSNWGEGISTFNSDNITIEDNESWDNWSNNYYISDTAQTLVQRNLSYFTSSMPTNGSKMGICMADEQQNPYSSNNVVINNMSFNGNRNFSWWHSSSTNTIEGLVNALIANNTFVDARGVTNSSDYCVIKIDSGNHVNTRIINNIFEQNKVSPLAIIADNDLKWTNNMWSALPTANAQGVGDIITNALILKTGSTNAGEMTTSWFKVPANSPAIGAAITLTEFTNDAFGTVRSGVWDVGAYEYVSSGLGNMNVISNMRVGRIAGQ